MPIYRKPYTNLDQTTPLDSKTLTREISARTNIRPDTVKEILDSFAEVATEEIVNKGYFRFDKIFTVKSFFQKGVRLTLGESPERMKLSIRLNHSIKKLWKSKLSRGSEDFETYEELLENSKEDQELKPSAPRRAIVSNAPQTIAEKSANGGVDWNPLLDDDDEY